jgi:adenosylmethionine-8-amino-7-oxononanoate aminotransferase
VSAPPYVITKAQVDQLVDALAASLQDVARKIGN